ncbi:TetR/AcrR family transcriptional regulator C-terminal domain-containing protein [Actinoplanes sp. NPDC049802]|uniref:TetR/AcrR family transcriptional regulator C-terminal domain-containing protein n=1 Tax=Actinoplanes sp. NPDC049802 TaxID=3154742 RepID=UPI0033CC9F41
MSLPATPPARPRPTLRPKPAEGRSRPVRISAGCSAGRTTQLRRPRSGEDVLPARDITVIEGTWQEQLRRLAYEFRAFSLAHRDLIRYAFAADDFIQRDGPMWRSLCAVVRDAGLRESDVERTGAVPAVLVGGLLHTEVNGMMSRLVGAGEAEDAGFALAVELLIDGVAARS